MNALSGLRRGVAVLILAAAVPTFAADTDGDAARSEEVVVDLASDGQVTTQILDTEGKILRTIRAARSMKAGPYRFRWDGRDDRGEALPPGRYVARVLVNRATYTTAGALGNTAQPPTLNQNPADIVSVAVDADGHIYTANFWEEAAQDFRKVDRDTGNHVYNSRASIRNGSPNALPYAIAVDDTYLYCSTRSHTARWQQHLRRFQVSDGRPAPWPARSATDGHILLHEDPEKEIAPDASDAVRELQKLPLRALAAADGRLLVADALAGRVRVFDRETGAETGGFDVALPHALALDSAGRIWVGHAHGRISVFDRNGTKLGEPVTDLGQIASLAFGPGDTLHVADSAVRKIFRYQTHPKTASVGERREFGGPAGPGDADPARFYRLKGAAVDRQGRLTVAQGFPTMGSRLAHFSPEGALLWDQLGTEFCTTGNMAEERPDEVISHYFHRYEVDKTTGAWTFRGNVLAGDPKYIQHHHGPMRRLKLRGVEFVFQSYGDGLQVYRRADDGTYRLSAMFGRNNPFPDGRFRDLIPEDERPEEILPWAWHDANGDGTVNEEEITRMAALPPDFNFFNFGVTVDRSGNALMCNDAITEIPLTDFDAHGNPIYDLSRMRVLMRRDPSDTAVIHQPTMAVRADDGTIYALAKSRAFPKPPEANFGWMTGWVLARFTKDGERLWAVPLREACPGIDVIPGPDGGVMVVGIKWRDRVGSTLYHYASDGSLVGTTSPSKKFLGYGGIPDNTASLAISRDPRDGILDVFVEDCVGNRFLWYRVDDRQKPEVLLRDVVLRELAP
ncbi:MAG: hypothetical protein IAE97_00510 [Chthoniobacterales bacterium]|nr:hypothetical protein [Chthoniobacterales bacterium]